MLKKQLIKFIISIVITSIIYLAVIILPPKNEAEISVKIKVNDNIVMLSKINRDFSIQNDGGFVILEEKDTLDKLQKDKQVLDNCKFLQINNNYLMSLSKPNIHTYEFNFVVDRKADQEKCSLSILDLFNEIGLAKIRSYLLLLKLSEKYSIDINNIELNTNDPNTKTHALNLDVNDKYNKSKQKNIFVFLEDISETDGYFKLVRSDIKFKGELNNFGSFFIIFLCVFLVANIRGLINLLKDY